MRIDPGDKLPQEVEASILKVLKQGQTVQIKFVDRDGTYKVYGLRPKLDYEGKICQVK